jgi:hypothetical protein
MGPAVTSRLLAERGGRDEGTSLIETMGAMVLIAIVMAGLMSLDAVASKMTENYGHLAARTAEYAQDKMEQLVGLAYSDSSTDTTVFPAAATGGTGLGSVFPAGSVVTSAPVAGYVDYLDQNGKLLASGGGAPAGWFYERVWRIDQISTTLKKITVTVTVARGAEHVDPASSTMSVLKSYPF